MPGRETALSNLLGVSTLSAIEAYPDVLALPEYIHASALEIVTRTAADGRERSMHFRHRFEHWTGGLAIKGPQPKINEDGSFSKARINWLHLNSTVFYPPHIHLHTHPVPNVTTLEPFSEVAPETLDDETIDWMKDIVGQGYAMSARLPSSADIYRSIKDPLASVGHLVASETGNFLWVHRDISATKGLSTNNHGKQYKERCSHAREMRQFVEENEQLNITFGEQPDFEQLTSDALAKRAWALSSAYVCYASGDVQSPQLTKVAAPNH